MSCFVLEKEVGLFRSSILDSEDLGLCILFIVVSVFSTSLHWRDNVYHFAVQSYSFHGRHC